MFHPAVCIKEKVNDNLQIITSPYVTMALALMSPNLLPHKGQWTDNLKKSLFGLKKSVSVISF